MESRVSFAPGKIILSGEYAVIFGYPGIAVPVSIGVGAAFKEDPSSTEVEVRLVNTDNDGRLYGYLKKIVELCKSHMHKIRQSDCRIYGRVVVKNDLPVGRGMGSSTAFVIAITRALLGENEREIALRIEDEMNPGHSGLDFETIWGGAPVLFRKGVTTKPIVLTPDLLEDAILIDTGLPSESTPQLVAWVRSRESDVANALKMIGECTERLASGEPLFKVMRDHHKAQVALGVVPPSVQDLVAAIEGEGGSAKIVGAGSRTGGGGMVLALGDRENIKNIADQRNMTTMSI